MKNNKSKSENKQSKNLKSGKFKVNELKLYGLNERDIKTILDFQEKLPMLQEESVSWIDGRKLHDQLGVKRDYTTWIKDRISKYEFEDNTDFKVCSPNRGSKKGSGGHNKINYALTLDMAKSLAMVQNNDIGKLTRRYFIAIEKAFKNRIEWNLDRDETIEMFKELRRSLRVFDKELKPTLPKWARNNQYIGEFAMLNEIVIGMSATDFRFKHCLSKTYPIRNKFTEQDLEYVHILEKYDADLIRIQEIFDYNKRKEILIKKFNTMVE